MPKIGDVLLRGDRNTGFELVRAGTLECLQAGIPSVEAAIDLARAHGAGAIWQQSFDNRGRALGDPVRLHQFTSHGDGNGTARNAQRSGRVLRELSPLKELRGMGTAKDASKPKAKNR